MLMMIVEMFRVIAAPYNLLLPRGTDAGMNFRLLVMVTDWAIDQVPDDRPAGQ